jgi:hypothetical protein
MANCQTSQKGQDCGKVQLFAEAWLGRGERQTSEGGYGVKPNSREKGVKGNDIDWSQKAHGGAFCTSCKIKLMEELEAGWEELEEVHVRIPCTKTRVDRQRYYSRQDVHRAHMFVLELEMVREGLQERQKEEERKKLQREQGEFGKFLDGMGSRTLAIFNQDSKWAVDNIRRALRHQTGEQWELARQWKKGLKKMEEEFERKEGRQEMVDEKEEGQVAEGGLEGLGYLKPNINQIQDRKKRRQEEGST